MRSCFAIALVDCVCYVGSSGCSQVVLEVLPTRAPCASVVVASLSMLFAKRLVCVRVSVSVLCCVVCVCVCVVWC